MQMNIEASRAIAGTKETSTLLLVPGTAYV